MKKLVSVAIVILMSFPAQSAIVFDGTNSYSSYTGRAVPIKTLFKTQACDALVLKEFDANQIDYTTPTQKNKTSISEPEGVHIEAEGLYAIKILDFCGGSNVGSIRPCNGGNGFVLGSCKDSVFEYPIDVRTPGIYTFTIDAAGDRTSSTLEMFGVQNNETPSDAQRLATWLGYNTGDWKNIVQNFGGLNKDTPYSVEVKIGKQLKKLVFAMGKNVNLDCIRITGFKPLTSP